MNWKAVFELTLPILGAFVPGAVPFLPLIHVGVLEADGLIGATGTEKRAHVLNLVAIGAATASATGKFQIAPADAQAIAAKVITVVDGIRAAHDAAAITK